MICRVNIHFDDSKFQAFIRDFPEIKEKANRAAGFVIMEDIENRFEGEGNPPQKWTPLKPITIERRSKRSNGGAIKILNDTGELKNSFMVGDPDNYFKATSQKVTVGTKKVYAPPHQWGWKGKNNPARPMIVDPANSQDLLDKLYDTYAEVLKRAL